MPIQLSCPAVNRQEWIARCAARLQEQWPRVSHDQLVELTQEMRLERERQEDSPEYAASAWLARGIPNNAQIRATDPP